MSQGQRAQGASPAFRDHPGSRLSARPESCQRVQQSVDSADLDLERTRDNIVSDGTTEFTFLPVFWNWLNFGRGAHALVRHVSCRMRAQRGPVSFCQVRLLIKLRPFNRDGLITCTSKNLSSWIILDIFVIQTATNSIAAFYSPTLGREPFKDALVV